MLLKVLGCCKDTLTVSLVVTRTLYKGLGCCKDTVAVSLVVARTLYKALGCCKGVVERVLDRCNCARITCMADDSVVKEEKTGRVDSVDEILIISSKNYILSNDIHLCGHILKQLKQAINLE